MIYPPNNALNVTNQPTIVWQSATNYSEQELYTPNSGYALPVTQKSYSGATLDRGPQQHHPGYLLLFLHRRGLFGANQQCRQSALQLGLHLARVGLCQRAIHGRQPGGGFQRRPRYHQFAMGHHGRRRLVHRNHQHLQRCSGRRAKRQRDRRPGFDAFRDGQRSGNTDVLLVHHRQRFQSAASFASSTWTAIYSNNITGDTDWYQDGPYAIGPGQHTLSWTSSANGDTDPTQAGYLDQVSYVPASSPTLTVTASPQAGLAPLAVQFTSPIMDSFGNTVTNWNWNFGDGGNQPERKVPCILIPMPVLIFPASPLTAPTGHRPFPLPAPGPSP